MLPVETGRGDSGLDRVGEGVAAAKLLLLLLRELWTEIKCWVRRADHSQDCGSKVKHVELMANLFSVYYWVSILFI